MLILKCFALFATLECEPFFIGYDVNIRNSIRKCDNTLFQKEEELCDILTSYYSTELENSVPI